MVLLRFLLVVVLLGAVLFGAAGRWDVPFFWALLGVYALLVMAMYLAIEPALRRERLRPAAAGHDRPLRLGLGVCLLGQWITAGLDVGRYHWSDTVPAPVQLGGLAGFAGAMGLAIWAMRVNRFFTPAIRIQEERGHHLVDTGPYCWVRHPGYAFGMVAFICGSLTLGSWLALVPAAGFLLLYVYRTAREDRFLQGHLAGYPEYAQRVRYRLLPGVW